MRWRNIWDKNLLILLYKGLITFILLSFLHLLFRTQFRTSTGRNHLIDLRRGPTGAELAENELHHQQVVCLSAGNSSRNRK